MLNDSECIKQALQDNEITVQYGDVEVGQSYPLYGMITKFIDERPGRVVAELNHGQIVAEFKIFDKAAIERLKSRAFDPGIFVATVEQKFPQIRVSCSTVIFGTKSKFSA
jgi:hypothetical protein